MMPTYGGSDIMLADAVPSPEATSSSAGIQPFASRMDHKHPRQTSAQNATLDANGYATITFSRTFSVEPVLVFGSLGAGTNPVPDFRGDLIKTGDQWTGVTVYGQVSRALPTQTPVGAGALLTGVITGLNMLITSLSGFLPYGPAAGARVSVTAIQPSV